MALTFCGVYSGARQGDGVPALPLLGPSQYLNDVSGFT